MGSCPEGLTPSPNGGCVNTNKSKMSVHDGRVMKTGGRAQPRRKFNTGGHAHIPQGSMGAPNHRHSIYNHVNEFHRNDPAYSGSDQDQHLSGHVNQAHQNNWYGQGEGSPGNNQTRMNRVNRMKKGGKFRKTKPRVKKYPHGGVHPNTGGMGNVRGQQKTFNWSWLEDGGISKMKGRYYSGQGGSNPQQCDCRCECDVPIEAMTKPDGTLCPTSPPHGGPKFHEQPNPVCDSLMYYDWDGDLVNDVEGTWCHFEQHGINDGFSIDYYNVETSEDCTELCQNHCSNNPDECGQLFGSCGATIAPQPQTRSRIGSSNRTRMVRKRGGRARKRNRRAMGGSMGSCPPGQHMMPDGTCMDDNDPSMNGGGYRRGGRPKPRRKMKHGGTHRGNRRTNGRSTAQRKIPTMHCKCMATFEGYGYGSDACFTSGYDCTQHMNRQSCDMNDTQGCGWVSNIGNTMSGR